MTDLNDPTDSQIIKYANMDHHLLAVRAAMQLLKIEQLTNNLIRATKRIEHLEILIDKYNAMEGYIKSD